MSIQNINNIMIIHSHRNNGCFLVSKIKGNRLYYIPACIDHSFQNY